jgi:hypothetical protein
VRGTWEGPGTAAGSAGRTSWQEFGLEQNKRTIAALKFQANVSLLSL